MICQVQQSSQKLLSKSIEEYFHLKNTTLMNSMQQLTIEHLKLVQFQRLHIQEKT